MKTKDEQIKNIMQHFDWKRVEKVMKSLNWTWFNSKQPPTIEEMQKHALGLLRDVCKPKLTGCRSGGFYASRDGKILRLEFCVEYMDGDEG